MARKHYIVSRAGWLLVSIAASVATLMAAFPGCDGDADAPSVTGSARAAPSALTPELARKVLAKVGDRTITLGDYAATLERMDDFERLRYQSPERRKKLLDEMIKVELLAQEARRRGLHKKPETQQRLREMLRDEVLARVRREVPKPADIPESEVRRYYDERRAQFRDPERRRVAHIVVASRQKAEQLLRSALEASPIEWGKLVKEHSLDRLPSSQTDPLELAGDLGIVSAPSSGPSDNPKVAEPLRTAVFAIDKLGAVHDKVVQAGGKFHIVRLTGKTDARERTFAEAERTIRVALVQQKIRAKEEEFERKLRQRFPVKLDPVALDKVGVPSLEKNDARTRAPAAGSN